MPSAPRHADTYVISLTPFDGAGRIDEDGLRAHLRRLARSGIGVYVGGGGSGEGHTFTPDETRLVLAVAVEELKDRVPVRAMGTEPRTAGQLVDLGRLAASAGVEAMQVYSLDAGHAYVPSPREIERYFSDVIDGVSLPVVISTHHFNRYVVPPDVLVTLCDRFEHVIGINCTSPDLRYVSDVVARLRERVEIHVGAPEQALSILALGGTGFLSSEANVTPRLAVSIIDAYRRGDLDLLHRRYAEMIRVWAFLQSFGSIRGVKGALKLLGLPGGVPRSPRSPLDEEEERRLAGFIAEVDLARHLEPTA